ncbi:MAG: hypothetical protein KF712_12010 [Akkermansiaceae bacterium]|nr:hypothetical protein [Akkermansiaceae bacterium]
MVPWSAKSPSLAAVFAFSLAIPFSTIGTTHAQEPAAEEEAQPDPTDVYFQGFNATRAAEKLEQAGDFIGAAEKLDEARKCFESIQRDHPDWKKDMVAGRMERVGHAIAEIRRKAMEPLKNLKKVPARVEPAPDPAELKALEETIRRMSRG